MQIFRETHAYTDETELHGVSESGYLCRLEHKSKCTLRLLSCVVAAGDIQMGIIINFFGFVVPCIVTLFIK
jgi:hypothetical protein